MANVGGQAVLEGVMMRGPGNWAVAVRTPNGTIEHVARPIDSAQSRHWVFRLPVIRGVVALFLRGVVGRDRKRAEPDRERLAERDDTAKDRQPQKAMPRHRRVDRPRDLSDRAGRRADGDSPVPGAAHHHALEDRLPPDCRQACGS